MKNMMGVLFCCVLFSLTGCVTLTSEVGGDEAVALESAVPVSEDHPFFQAISVGKVSGFSGTSVFPILGRVSPDMDNDGVRFALERTLDNVSMLSEDPSSSEYYLDAIFLDNNEEGAWGVGITHNRITRVGYEISGQDGVVLYSAEVESEGGDSTSVIMPFYLNEKRTAVRSYQENFGNVANLIMSWGASSGSESKSVASD